MKPIKNIEKKLNEIDSWIIKVTPEFRKAKQFRRDYYENKYGVAGKIIDREGEIKGLIKDIENLAKESKHTRQIIDVFNNIRAAIKNPSNKHLESEFNKDNKDLSINLNSIKIKTLPSSAKIKEAIKLGSGDIFYVSKGIIKDISESLKNIQQKISNFVNKFSKKIEFPKPGKFLKSSGIVFQKFKSLTRNIDSSKKIISNSHKSSEKEYEKTKPPSNRI